MRARPLLAVAVLLSACGGSGGEAGQSGSGTPTINAEARLEAAKTPAQRRAVTAQIPGKSAAGGSSPARVIQVFERETGARLVRETGSARHVVLSLPTADAEGNPLPDDAAERFGSFSLYVAEEGSRIADIGALGDVLPSAMPDARGIVWRADRDPLGERLFTAHAFYAGGTVMVAWLGGERRTVDASFHRLDKVLRKLGR